MNYSLFDFHAPLDLMSSSVALPLSKSAVAIILMQLRLSFFTSLFKASTSSSALANATAASLLMEVLLWLLLLLDVPMEASASMDVTRKHFTPHPSTLTSADFLEAVCLWNVPFPPLNLPPAMLTLSSFNNGRDAMVGNSKLRLTIQKRRVARHAQMFGARPREHDVRECLLLLSVWK